MSDERENTTSEVARDDDAPDARVDDSDAATDALAFDVSDAEAGARLDAFLASRVEGVSRTLLKRAIEDGDVTVEGRVAKPSYKLRAGERVELDELPIAPTSELTPEDIPLDIIHEDEDVVVVNKPAGMVVHPAAGVYGGTLANALAHRLRIAEAEAGEGEKVRRGESEKGRRGEGETGRRGDGEKVRGGEGEKEVALSNISPSPPLTFSPSHFLTFSPSVLRPGIVHRLDRDTSGLIVVAKNARAHESLAEQFRARTVFKSYLALVHGVVREEKGKIEEPIARDARNRTRMTVARNGRTALSLWRVRRRFERMTLLDVQIKTGRTHQIRVHLAWMKHPVVGDEVYGMGRDRNIQNPRLRAAIAALGRQFLHAERLGFQHPRTGEWMSFTAPLPRELSDFLEALELRVGKN